MDVTRSPRELSGIRPPEVSAAGPRPLVRPAYRDDAVLFDFLAAVPLPPEAKPVVTRSHEQTERFGLTLSLLAGRLVQVTCSAIARVPASALNTDDRSWFRLHTPEAGDGAFLIDNTLAVAVADLLMGGAGHSEDRAPSSVELALLRKHLPGPVGTFNPVSTVLNVGDLQLGTAGEDLTRELQGRELTCLTLDVQLPATDGTITAATVTVALPGRAVPAADQPAPEVLAHPEAVEALIGVPLTLSARLPSVLIGAHDVAALRPGDIIRVGHLETEPIDILAGGQRLMTAFLGHQGSRLTICIDRLLEED